MHPSNPFLPIYVRTYRHAGINAYRHTSIQIGKGFRVTTSLLSSHLLFAGHQSSSMLGPGSSAAPGSPSEMPVWDPRRWGCWWCAPWRKPLIQGQQKWCHISKHYIYALLPCASPACHRLFRTSGFWRNQVPTEMPTSPASDSDLEDALVWNAQQNGGAEVLEGNKLQGCDLLRSSQIM